MDFMLELRSGGGGREIAHRPVERKPVNNPTNAHPVVDFNNTICLTAGTYGSCAVRAGEPLLREYTSRPRTYGLTLILRKYMRFS
ncbi:MAG: hypothetical protein WCB10_00910 [Steroidobacteraceae bacterium]